MNPLSRYGFRLLFFLAGSFLFITCSDDDYYYPSVKLEFLTAYSDQTGALTSILTDDGQLLQVVENSASVQMQPDTCMRIVANYEELERQGNVGVKIYSLTRTFTSLPIPVNTFEEELITAPAKMVSIWPGLDFLNIVLTAKQQGSHTFAYLEEDVSADSDSGNLTVQLLLYHASTGEVEDYSKRAYLSIPLKQYLTEGVEKLSLSFTFYTDSGTWETYQVAYTP